MTLEEFFRLEPRFHLDQHGDPISWGLHRDVLQYMNERVSPGSGTLETGAGLSTVLFALCGCRHTAVSPAALEFDKIRAFCGERNIPLDTVELVANRSEVALPNLRLSGLDLVLVDGRHAFPSPFIDWYYGADMLKVGGIMAIDDTQLETGRILKDFMSEDHRWQFAEEVGKTVFFEKLVEEVHRGEWTEQPYLMNRT